MTDKEKEQLQEAEQHRKNKLIHLTKIEKENLLKLEDGFNQYVLNYQNPTDLTGYALESWVQSQNYLTSYSESDPIFTAHLSNNPNKYLDWTNTSSNLSTTGLVGIGGAVSATDRVKIITSASETSGLYIDGSTNPYTGISTNIAITSNKTVSTASIEDGSFFIIENNAMKNTLIVNGVLAGAPMAAGESNFALNNIVRRNGTITGASNVDIINYGMSNLVQDQVGFNSSGITAKTINSTSYGLINTVSASVAPIRGTKTVNLLGLDNSVNTSISASSLKGIQSVIYVSGGTTTNAYGIYTSITTLATITNGYGLYINSVGGTTAYGIYDNSGKNWFMKDNAKHIFGTGLDVDISYTGTIWEFDVKQATTSIRFNAVTKTNTDFEVWGDTAVLLHLDASSDKSYIRPNSNQTTSFQFQNIAGTGSALTVDTTNLRVGINKATAPSYPLDVVGEIYSSTTITNPKIKLTAEGGYAVKMTNRTGGASVKGNVVHPSATYANAVELIVVDVPNPIGVFYEDGIADGAEAWVVVSGIADVYYVGNTTLNHIARGFLTADGVSYVIGQALSEAIPTSPFNVDKHFYEIGHITEARTGAGLAKTILHFN